MDVTHWLTNPPIWLAVVFLIVGFVVLSISADTLVSGASGIAKRFKLSDLMIGLTIVAMGTSMPELVVNITAAIQGDTSLAITNILGSNIINIMIILGITALVYPVACSRENYFDIILCCLGAVLVLAFTFREGGDTITRLEGSFLVLIFIAFMFYTIIKAKKSPVAEPVEEPATNKKVRHYKTTIWYMSLQIVIGITFLVVGGEMIVKAATTFAEHLGIPDAVIGVTVVAFGTSLPELATSIAAARKHYTDLAIGNVLGSNIFNVFMVLGVTSTIFPLGGYEGLRIDALLALISSVLLFIFALGKKHRISRGEGAVFVFLYLGYVAFIVYNLVK